jgi:nucleolar pre-ribosomal-associated protein 1
MARPATMTKRSTDRLEEDGSQVYLKRQKIKHVPSPTEEIQSSRHLEQLLSFDQDIGRARHGNSEFNLYQGLY